MPPISIVHPGLTAKVSRRKHACAAFEIAGDEDAANKDGPSRVDLDDDPRRTVARIVRPRRGAQGLQWSRNQSSCASNRGACLGRMIEWRIEWRIEER